MFGASIGRGASRIINAMVEALARSSINPNLLTVTGVAINVLCGLLFGFGQFFWAGIILIVANLFDMLDGKVARVTGRVTRFGAFLDSSLDRLSDMVIFVGLMVPHVVRSFTGPDLRWILPYATVLAPVLLLGADVIGRIVARPAELQVGIVTAVIGGPVFIFLVRRRRTAQL